MSQPSAVRVPARPAQRLVRIAHGGGGSLAPFNSLAGVERSLALGIEMVELDVRCARDGVLVLSHDDALNTTGLRVSAAASGDLRRAGVAALDDALALVDGRARLNLDIKDAAASLLITDALRRRDAVDWCVVSGLEREWLGRVMRADPALQAFLSYPADRGGASRRPWLKPVVDAVVLAMRLTMPMRLPSMVRPLPGAGVTLYHPLVTRRLVALVHGLGIPLYTWTVDDPADMRRLMALGVDGITSNRPDLLAALTQPDAARV